MKYGWPRYLYYAPAFILTIGTLVYIPAKYTPPPPPEPPQAVNLVYHAPIAQQPAQDTGARFTLTAADTDARLDRYNADILEGRFWELPDTGTTAPSPEDDRSQPIYEVYKNGCPVNAPADIQWMIHDLAKEYGFDEKLIFGMIVAESTFNPRSSGNGCYGLAQITKYWLHSKALEPYRITDDYKTRDLLDPYANLLTLTELWRYAVDTYGLDLSTERGMTELLYFHNTGDDPGGVTHWAYATRIFKYMDELVEVAK